LLQRSDSYDKKNDFLNRNLKDCIFLRKHFSGKWHSECQPIS